VEASYTSSYSTAIGVVLVWLSEFHCKSRLEIFTTEWLPQLVWGVVWEVYFGTED